MNIPILITGVMYPPSQACVKDYTGCAISETNSCSYSDVCQSETNLQSLPGEDLNVCTKEEEEEVKCQMPSPRTIKMF